MATRDSIVSFNLVEGINTADDDKISSGLKLLQNATLVDKETPRKRSGVTSKTTSYLGQTSGTIDNAQSCDIFKDELVIQDGEKLFGYSEELDKWIHKGSSANCVLEKEDVYFDNGNDQLLDLTQAELGNIQVFTAKVVGSTLCKVVVYDKSTKSVIHNTEVAFANVKAFATTTTIGYIYYDTGISNLKFATWDAATATLIVQAGTLTAGNVDANGFFDLTQMGTSLLIAYFDNTTNVVFRKYNDDLTTLQSSGGVNPTSGNILKTGPMQIYYEPVTDKVFVGFGSLSGTDSLIYWCRRNNDLSADIAPVLSNTIAGSPNVLAVQLTLAVTGDTLYMFSTEYDSVVNEGAKTYRQIYTVSTQVQTSTATFGAHLSIASKAFIYEGECYFTVLYAGLGSTVRDDTSRVYCLMSASELVFARYFYNVANYVYDPILSGFRSFFPEPIINSDTVEIIAGEVVRTDLLNARIPVDKTSLKKITLDFRSTNRAKSFVMGKNLVRPGACPKLYDGVKSFEYGLNHRAWIKNITTAAGALTGTYNYKVIYEYVDAQGVKHYSEPSAAFSQTYAAEQGTIFFGNYSVGENKSGVKTHIFRTENAGQTYYRVTSSDGIDNDPNAYYTSFVDNVGDGTLVSNDPYEFDGGVIEPMPAPPFKSATIYNNRVFVIASDQRNQAWYAQEYAPNLQGMFSEFLKVGIEETNQTPQDEAVCNHTLDDKYIVFKSNSMSFITGEGPNPLGANDNFTRPVLISTDAGCSNARSIVSMPLGIMFESNKGIYLLSRNLETIYIGHDVNDYLTSSITGAFLHENSQLVVFTQASGPALIYDYLHNKWSVFQNYTANDCTFWKDKIVHVTSAGVAKVENGNHDDDGSFVPMKLESNWIKMAGLQEYQRLKRVLILGKFKSAHNLKISMAYDYHDYNWQEITFTPLGSSSYNITSKPALADLYTGTNDGTYQVKAVPQKQKCQAFKITIEDVETTAQGESLELTNVSFLVGRKRGPFKVQSEKRT